MLLYLLQPASSPAMSSTVHIEGSSSPVESRDEMRKEHIMMVRVGDMEVECSRCIDLLLFLLMAPF